jgi:FkbM family methyltransferase
MKTEIFENTDGKFIIFPNDAIAQHIKNNKLWEPHFKVVISHLVKEGDTVIDCGANFGYNAVIMGKHIGPNGTLIAFEPQRIIHQQLNGNLILNNIYNAITIQCALGDGSISTTNMRYVDYELPWVNIGDTSIGEGGEEVEVHSLDSINISNVDFIKIDVQGYELLLLQGAKETISKFKPDLFIEIEPHQLVKFNTTPEQLINYIKSLGYRMFRIDNEYPCDHICTQNNLELISDLQNYLPLVEI